jgi:hypothetical protein
VRCLVWIFLLASFASPAFAQEISPAQIREALEYYRDEPRVDDVVSAALRARGRHPDRVRDAMDRARITGALPIARFALRRGQAIDLRELALGGDDARTNLATGDDLMIEGSLVFRFDRIAFASEETALLRELRAAEEARSELVRAIVAIYFERRRLQIERDLMAADLARAIRILELEALLDALTDGAFSRM